MIQKYYAPDIYKIDYQGDESHVVVLYLDHMSTVEAAMDCRKFERDELLATITEKDKEIERLSGCRQSMNKMLNESV